MRALFPGLCCRAPRATRHSRPLITHPTTNQRGDMNIIDRIRKILLSPKDEWPKIAVEAATVHSLYLGYIVILAAIGPLATLVSLSIIGFGFGVGAAIFAYIHSLIGVAILALIVDLLAPSFGGSRDYVAAMKLVAYSFTAVWVAQLALLIPVAGFLVVL